MPRLLDQVRDAIRVHHSSIRIGDAYVNGLRQFIRSHGTRHPVELGELEVNASLSPLMGWPGRLPRRGCTTIH